MSDKFRRERRHYPVLERYAYLDNATTGAIPQYACDAICRMAPVVALSWSDMPT